MSSRYLARIRDRSDIPPLEVGEEFREAKRLAYKAFRNIASGAMIELVDTQFYGGDEPVVARRRAGAKKWL